MIVYNIFPLQIIKFEVDAKTLDIVIHHNNLYILFTNYFAHFSPNPDIKFGSKVKSTQP